MKTIAYLETDDIWNHLHISFDLHSIILIKFLVLIEIGIKLLHGVNIPKNRGLDLGCRLISVGYIGGALQCAWSTITECRTVFDSLELINYNFFSYFV